MLRKLGLSLAIVAGAGVVVAAGAAARGDALLPRFEGPDTVALRASGQLPGLHAAAPGATSESVLVVRNEGAAAGRLFLEVRAAGSARLRSQVTLVVAGERTRPLYAAPLRAATRVPAGLIGPGAVQRYRVRVTLGTGASNGVQAQGLKLSARWVAAQA